MKSHRVPIALQQIVMRVLRNKLAIASTKLGKTFTEPLINYRQRGTIAGSAHLEAWEIHLNPISLIENGEIFINQVIPHELAHLLVYHCFGKIDAHGKEWKWIMPIILDAPPQKIYQFALTSVHKWIFHYHCKCDLSHQLTLRRHNKIQLGKGEYICKKCGQYLIWQNQ
ncbi:SprT family zinc-dependent metalloprotease [Arsenophonus endosymbiont of Aleurodicus floccissimus]|uniref:SprT family zinc-dependent metalloprotease n=1 Tax=Arsenophonus endosymbiont of Aleurodicus floccissimus TaxID=2152761 RepID=UPI000E6AF4EC|nr:SprT family zinc-dependent metalloprotease [Arsenophonus endosymbiont of Aleurodicus floccissimus]